MHAYVYAYVHMYKCIYLKPLLRNLLAHMNTLAHTSKSFIRFQVCSIGLKKETPAAVAKPRKIHQASRKAPVVLQGRALPWQGISVQHLCIRA